GYNYNFTLHWSHSQQGCDSCHDTRKFVAMDRISGTISFNFILPVAQQDKVSRSEKGHFL
ncbi:MAG: hypothetical protein AAGU16_15165, partial [Desulfitobacterium hafniense]